MRRGEERRAINIREKALSTNRNNDAPGTIFASRIAGNGSTVPRRKSGRDEARRISCSTGKHVAEVKRGLINHIHRYNVYTRPDDLPWSTPAHVHTIHAYDDAHVHEWIPSCTRVRVVALYGSSKSLVAFFPPCVYLLSKVQLFRSVMLRHTKWFDSRYTTDGTARGGGFAFATQK